MLRPQQGLAELGGKESNNNRNAETPITVELARQCGEAGPVGHL